LFCRRSRLARTRITFSANIGMCSDAYLAVLQNVNARPAKAGDG
jgi:hypothetical protein